MERLDIHHRTYTRLGHERPADFLVLCRRCHKRQHRGWGGPRVRLYHVLGVAFLAVAIARLLFGNAILSRYGIHLP